MRFLPDAQHIDCSPLQDESKLSEELPVLAATATDVLEEYGVIVFRIGRLRLGEEESRQRAYGIAEAMRRELVARGAPDNLSVECGKVEKTVFNGNHQTRTMLPHHDGGHTSYLTPSTFDEPDWPVQRPSFADTGYTTTPAHKMYQAIFIIDPGEGLSVTTYYDWLRIIEDSRKAQGNGDDRRLTAWYGENITRMVSDRARFAFGYPTLAGMLRQARDAVDLMPLLRSEEALPSTAKQQFPELTWIVSACPCDTCSGETVRAFCHVVDRSLRLSWPEFRECYEVLAPTERYDLPFAHNLTMLHGGLCGGRKRVIEPICLTVHEPGGPAYERWLQASWQRPAVPWSTTLAAQ